MRAKSFLCHITENNLEQAMQFAAQIEDFNSDRKGLDKLITQEALNQIEVNYEQERYTTVVYNENWHKGVIGIVASRLTETYYRPTLVFTKSGDKLACGHATSRTRRCRPTPARRLRSAR